MISFGKAQMYLAIAWITFLVVIGMLVYTPLSAGYDYSVNDRDAFWDTYLSKLTPITTIIVSGLLLSLSSSDDYSRLKISRPIYRLTIFVSLIYFFFILSTFVIPVIKLNSLKPDQTNEKTPFEVLKENDKFFQYLFWMVNAFIGFFFTTEKK